MLTIPMVLPKNLNLLKCNRKHRRPNTMSSATCSREKLGLTGLPLVFGLVLGNDDFQYHLTLKSNQLAVHTSFWKHL